MWQDLLQDKAEEKVLPWVGGRFVVDRDRRWQIRGRRPPEHGWHRFRVGSSRDATWVEATEPDPAFGQGRAQRVGVLVGNRLIPDGARVDPDPAKLVEQTLPVHLVERGLPRFSRARVAQDDAGNWLYLQAEFPLGPEPDVHAAFVDGKADLTDIRDVTPALELAFRFSVWQREEVARRREEAARRRVEEAARRQREAHQARMARLVGTGEGRRELAALDFTEAARAALATAGAALLDVRDAVNEGEKVVQFRFGGGRFECVVDARSLRVIDAGICLIDHATGERGDTRFTLESLPGVIEQARREARLVRFRHV